MTNTHYSQQPAGLTEKKLEWMVALCALCTAAVCVAGAAAFVASVFFGWGAI